MNDMYKHLELSPRVVAETRNHFQEEFGLLEQEGYTIERIYDLIPWIKKEVVLSSEDPDLLSEYRDALGQLSHLFAVDFTPLNPQEKNPLLHGHRAVIMETTTKERAVVTVVRHDTAREGNFGGAGVYDHSGSQSRMATALKHSEHLAEIMTAKAYAIGVQESLRGSKTIIDSRYWISNPTLQFITGMLFSPQGPFPKVITGSDAGQTTDSIERMGRGSKLLGGEGQIVGTKEGLPETAKYCQYTLQATYETLRELFPEQGLPRLDQAVASIQGFGKIGNAAAEMLLQSGTKTIIITDALLYTDTLNALCNKMGWSQEDKVKLHKKAKDALRDFKNRATKKEVSICVVHPEKIYDSKSDIYLPCSTAEGDLTNEKIDRLKKSGAKIILSGANSPLASNEVASYVELCGLMMPNETLSNGGSATSAALEAIQFLRQQDIWNGNHELFVESVLIPHIYRTVKERLEEASLIAKETGACLHEASIIATNRWLSQQAA